MIKKLMQGIGITMFCFLLFLLPVKAADPSVSLKEDGNDVKVVLELSDTAKSMEAVSLKLSFEIDKKPAEEDISFEFDSGIKSKSEVKEFRYHEESGRLNIYISGTTNLFEEDSLSLGKIALKENVKGAIVSVDQNSLVIVNRAFDMKEIKLSESSDAKPGETTNPEKPTTSGSSGSNTDKWESDNSGSYPKGPGSNSNHILIPIDNKNNTPKPGINVNTNPTGQDSMNKQDTIQSTLSANTEETTQTTASNESTTPPLSASESNNQLVIDNTSNNQSAQNSNRQPAGSGTNTQNSNSNGNNSISTSNEAISSGTGEGVTTELSLLESQPQSEGQTITDTKTERDSAEATQEAAIVSNPNRKEKSSDRNTLLMMILGFILVIAAGGAVFVFKLTETPKRKKR